MFSKFKNILQENISEFINEKDEFNDNDSKPLDLYSEFKTLREELRIVLILAVKLLKAAKKG